jgi:hypothetical protein
MEVDQILVLAGVVLIVVGAHRRKKNPVIGMAGALLTIGAMLSWELRFSSPVRIRFVLIGLSVALFMVGLVQFLKANDLFNKLWTMEYSNMNRAPFWELWWYMVLGTLFWVATVVFILMACGLRFVMD